MCCSMKSPIVVAEYGFKYPRVSPTRGSPILPGGRLSLGCFRLKRRKKRKRARMDERKQRVRYESDIEPILSGFAVLIDISVL